MEKKQLVIAIDGFSSCGKSTIARSLAKELGLAYVDSGAMYRAVTLYLMINNLPIPNKDQLNSRSFNYTKILDDIKIHFEYNASTGRSDVFLNDKNVEAKIRTMDV
ncbi:MAG: cytidylate kinase, partial [Bacteroidia bacterium]|nr:cytidylate kinase [Bacteroidia bacterium]